MSTQYHSVPPYLVLYLNQYLFFCRFSELGPILNTEHLRADNSALNHRLPVTNRFRKLKIPYQANNIQRVKSDFLTAFFSMTTWVSWLLMKQETIGS